MKEQQINTEINTEQSTVQITPHTNTAPSSGKRYILLLAAIALLLCIGAGTAFASFYFAPKTVLLRAVKHTVSESNFPGFPSALASLQSGQYETSYSVTLGSLSVDANMPENNDSPFTNSARSYISRLGLYMEGIGIEGTTYTDTAAGQQTSDIAFSYYTKPYLSCSLYSGDNTLLFSIPELIDGSIMIKADTFGRDYNASVLSELTGVTLPEDYQLPLQPKPFPSLEALDLESMRVTKLTDTNAFDGITTAASSEVSYYECTWESSDIRIICMTDSTPMLLAAAVKNIRPVQNTDLNIPYAPDAMDVLISKQGSQTDITINVYDEKATVLFTYALTGALSESLDVLDDSTSLSYRLDSISLSDSVDGMKLTGYGNISIRGLQESIAPPDGARYEIFKMSKQELALLIKDIVTTWTEDNFSFFN